MAKKRTAKKTTKKSTKKVTTKKAAGRGKASNGLRKPQIRILEAMKGGKPMTRATICEKAGVDTAMSSAYIGRMDPAARKRVEGELGYKSLIGAGYVKVEQRDVKGKDTVVFTITANGKKALEAAKKAAK